MLLLSAYYGKHNRGCWKRLRRLLLHLADQDYKIRLAVSTRSADISHKNIEQVLLSLRFVPAWLNHCYFLAASTVLSFFTAIRVAQVRLVAFDGHNAFALLGAKLASRKARLFLSVRGHPSSHHDFNNYSPAEQVIFRVTDRIGHRFSDRVVYTSEETARRVGLLYEVAPGKSFCIPNDIVSPVAELDSQCGARLRRELGIPSDSFVIGFAGQFITRKNISFLIRALADKRLRSKAHLLLKGDGPLAAKLRHEAEQFRISEFVHFLPWDSQMDSFYRAVDIFVLPSLYDDCSNALLEAMSHGACVLASDCGGNREILSAGRELLFPVDDGGEKLVTILAGFLTDSGTFSRARTKSEDIARSFRFDWEAVMGEHALRA